MDVDYLIVGQGLCGSWLGYHLLNEGASVLVLDKLRSARSASEVASGIINPITGKRLARQWMGETILPFARAAYDIMGDKLGMPLASTVPIHTFFSNAEEASLFAQKAAHEELLSYDSHAKGLEHFNYHYGVGSIHPAMLVDMEGFISGWRHQLQMRNALSEDEMDWSACELGEDGVGYKDIRAKAVIDCGGAATRNNPWFGRLPFALNKGEVIIASIPGLPANAVYKYATLSIVPLTDGHFWLGSTFDWDFTDEQPTAAFRQRVEATLQQWLRLPYTLHEHFAAIRPATVTRDAFAGVHPAQRRLGLLNGMGSKGCSLAPFLANNLAQHLLHGTPLIAQVDVGRYARVLSR